MGLDSLAAAIGEERDTIEEVIEPYLIQQAFIMRTPRGRIATKKTYIHFGLTMPGHLNGQKQLNYDFSDKINIDELYEKVITKPLNFISEALHKVVDNQVIDGIVNGVGSAVNGMSTIVRKVQTGHIGLYIFSMVMGIILILFFTFIK